MDEFVYLVANKRLIDNNSSSMDVAIFKEYQNLFTDEDDPDPEKLEEICKEFNINKYTHLVDGENDFIENFLANFNQIKDKLVSVKKMRKLFVTSGYSRRLDEVEKETIINLQDENEIRDSSFKKQFEVVDMEE